MIPLGKLLTLLIKTFSKPMLNYAKKMNTQQRMTRMNSFFIWVGRKSFQIENFMNYSIRKMKFPTTVKQISDDSALQKGIENLHEILLYVFVLGLPLYEMHRASQSAKEKQEKLQTRLSNLEETSKEIEHRTLHLLTSKYLHLV